MTDKSVDRMSVVIALPAQLQNNQAPASRAWRISQELNISGIKTVIIGREARNDRMAGKNIIAIKPLLDLGFMGNLLFVFQLSLFIIRFLFTTKADQVIVREYSLAPLSLILKLWHKKIINDIHEYAYKEEIAEGRRLRAKVTKIFDWLRLKLSNHIITIREELCEDFPPDAQCKTILLPNGVDLEEFAFSEDRSILAKYSIPEDKKLVGFVGNWEAWIAINDILESAKYFDDEYRIVIIGRGKWFEEYKAKYSSVLFTDMIPHRDAIGILKKMDVCICPYSNEPIAKNKSYRKIYEYLAAGKPIVISDADSREKFLKEGENVLMYRAGDSEDLVAKVKILLNDDELHKTMSHNNMELAKQFTWEKVITRSGLIELLLGSK